MKRVGIVVVILAVMLLALPVFADHGTPTPQGNCPAEGKVEANGENQDEINDLVLDAGVHVCIKGGQTIRFVTADGESTLKELLDSRNQQGKLQDVSHYTVIEGSTTTTTTEDETTTTERETTTTTEGSTTTTEESTTTTEEEETTTTEATTSTSEQEKAVTATQLPFTGSGDMLPLTIGAVLLLLSGLGLIARSE